MAKKLRITQIHSTIDRQKRQKLTMVALGIHRMHQTVEHKDTPQVRGMIRSVKHLLKVEEVE